MSTVIGVLAWIYIGIGAGLGLGIWKMRDDIEIEGSLQLLGRKLNLSRAVAAVLIALIWPLGIRSGIEAVRDARRLRKNDDEKGN